MTTHGLMIELLPDEYWWGGRAADGRSMPFGTSSFSVDLASNLNGNQACPLLISSKGRYIWSEEPFFYQFEQNSLKVSGAGELISGEGHETLRGAYSYVSRTFFPPSSSIPEELLFTAPQYNLWIELLYEPTQEKVLQYAKDVLANTIIMLSDRNTKVTKYDRELKYSDGNVKAYVSNEWTLEFDVACSCLKKELLAAILMAKDYINQDKALTEDRRTKEIKDSSEVAGTYS